MYLNTSGSYWDIIGKRINLIYIPRQCAVSLNAKRKLASFHIMRNEGYKENKKAFDEVGIDGFINFAAYIIWRMVYIGRFDGFDWFYFRVKFVCFVSCDMYCCLSWRCKMLNVAPVILFIRISTFLANSMHPGKYCNF